MQSCRVDSHFEPPEPVLNIMASNVERETLPPDLLIVTFQLSWSRPSIANGMLTKYEVMLRTDPSSAETVHQRILPVSQYVPTP